MAKTETEDKWYNDYDTVVGFARTLENAGELTDAREVILYFEKPWKYDTEYDAWLEFDKPNSDDKKNWDSFIEKLEER
jgi:hypothetical protein